MYIGIWPSAKNITVSKDASSASATSTRPMLQLPVMRPIVSARRMPSRRKASVPAACSTRFAAKAAASVPST